MTSRRWRTAAILPPAAITAVALATPAAAASPSWQLTDQYTASPACFTTGGGSEYLELNLNGTWSTPLTFLLAWRHDQDVIVVSRTAPNGG